MLHEFAKGGRRRVVGQQKGRGNLGMGQRRELIKHSSAIQITNRINLLERRTWNVLMARAYDDLPSKEEHTIRLGELMRALSLSSKNYGHLKEILETLATTAVKWNVLGKDNQEEWGVTTLLAQAKIKRGLCTYAYSPEMRRRLHNPRIYAKINLSMQNRFTSKHALALYEMFVDYFDVRRKYGETPFIPVATFRQLMGLEDGEYREFKLLNRWVIKDPIREINDKSDLQVEAEYKKDGRKVAAVKFHIRPNPKRGSKVIEHLAPAESRPKRPNQTNRPLPDDDFEVWFQQQTEQSRKELEARAVELLSATEREEIASGRPTFTTRYQVEVNMRLLSQEERLGATGT
jgi:plasmid replication initiation protein